MAAARKPRPKTGEKRATAQPLKIDRLPSTVHDAILHLRNGMGKTWVEIEALSAEKYCPEWAVKGGGFIHWEALTTPVLILFPDMRLPHTSLHRWHDLRVAQVSREVMLRSKQAESIARAFAKSTVEDGDEAVINAARNVLMGVLSEDATTAGRLNATKGLLKLSEVMSKAKTNEIRERNTSIEERRIAQLEKDAELRRKRMEVETEQVVKKMGKGVLTIEDINKLRRNTFGLPPLPTVEASAV